MFLGRSGKQMTVCLTTNDSDAGDNEGTIIQTTTVRVVCKSMGWELSTGVWATKKGKMSPLPLSARSSGRAGPPKTL